MPEKYLYNTEQTAAYLGIAIETVRYHMKKGGDDENKLHPVMDDNPHYLGPQILVFTKDELDRFQSLDLKPGKQGDWKQRTKSKKVDK